VTENERKGWHAYLPAILTAATAFLAALSTIYINLRNDFREQPAPPKVVAAAAPVAPLQGATNTTLMLQLQRVEVLDDGSYGSTDWKFRVEADGRELFELPGKALSDEVGDNVIVPTADDEAQARVTLLPGQQVLVKVFGEGGGLLGSAEATGTGTLTVRGISGPVRVSTREKDGARFVFHFAASNAPAED
jgi:hypothetical protein